MDTTLSEDLSTNITLTPSEVRGILSGEYTLTVRGGIGPHGRGSLSTVFKSGD